MNQQQSRVRALEQRHGGPVTIYLRWEGEPGYQVGDTWYEGDPPVGDGDIEVVRVRWPEEMPGAPRPRPGGLLVDVHSNLGPDAV